MVTHTRTAVRRQATHVLPSSLSPPDRSALTHVVTALWQQAIGLDAVAPAQGVAAMADGLCAARGPLAGAALVHAWGGWIEILDHRCVDPAAVAAAVLDCAEAFLPRPSGWWGPTQHTPAPPTGAAARLLDFVRAHPDEPPPDAMVLSDALLHFLAEVGDSARLGTRLEHLHEVLPGALPPPAVLSTTDSIYYTPEARARLEARAQLNLARWRASTPDPRRMAAVVGPRSTGKEFS